MFGLSGVMINIKCIDVHIGHESSVGVCFAKISRIYSFVSSRTHRFCPLNGRWRVGRDQLFSSGLCRYA